MQKDDVIYRQQAIDAVQGIGRLATLPDNDAVVRMSAVEYVLFNLPSAQQEIIYCKDCKLTDGEKPIADGRYWCVLHESFMYFCSDAERWQ